MSDTLKNQTAIIGVGMSEIGRHTGKTAMALTMDAAVAAMQDGGLRPEQIDGITGLSNFGEGPSIADVAEGLGVPSLTWHSNNGLGGLASVIEAAVAISSGVCDTCLVYRVMMREISGPAAVRRSYATAGSGGLSAGGHLRVAGENQFKTPYGAGHILPWLSAWQRRQMHEYGYKPEHYGAIAVTCRYHASLNPRAPLRVPITMEDYLNSRFVAEPFRLLDCDYPVDAAAVVILTRADRARDFAKPPVYLTAAALGKGARPNWEQWADMTEMSAHYATPRVYRMAGLTPDDIDAMELYDGFTLLAMNWIEAFGFCKRGEAGPYVEGGHRIRLGGERPLNTHGGQLSEGRVHGIGQTTEATWQLRHEYAGTPRQIQGVRNIAVGTGGGPLAAAAIFTNDPQR